MLKLKTIFLVGEESGDTLIEVAIGLTILGVVLVGSTAIASTAFQMGQTAQDRTQISETAQEQMEALRSFRDNNTWANFEDGPNGIDTMPAAGFHMELSAGATTQWIPVAGTLTSGVTVTGGSMVITTNTPNAERDCGYNFVLAYSFIPPGGSPYRPASSQIETRLVNLQYDPTPGFASCP